MKTKSCSILIRTGLTVIVFLIHASRLIAEMPQEHWVEEVDMRYNSGSVQFIDMCQVGSNYYAVTASTSKLYVFTNQWWEGKVLVGESGAGDGQLSINVRGIASDGELLYVADAGNGRIQVFDLDGNYVRHWSAVCYRIDIDGDYVYAEDGGNSKVQVFSKTGDVIRVWGESGSAAGELYFMHDMKVHNGVVGVCEGDLKRVQLFDSYGNYIRSWSVDSTCISLEIDNYYVYVFHGSNSGSKKLEIFDYYGSSVVIKGLGYIDNNQAKGYVLSGYLRSIGHSLCLLAKDAQNVWWIAPFRQYSRTLGAKEPDMIPQARVTSYSQRSGLPILDIEYLVDDENPAVEVYCGVFIEPQIAGISLQNFLPARTFIDGSATNIGTNVRAGLTNSVSWNMEADGVPPQIGSYNDVKVALFCNDGRGLLDLHFLHLPDDDVGDALVINRAGIQQSDLLPLWFWQLAKGDPALVFTNGVISGANGDYEGQVLAQNTETTEAGRNYMFDLMGLREATPAELQRAREGASAGTVYEWPVRRVPPSGSTVNEYNFVTSPTNGWWVVPL